MKPFSTTPTAPNGSTDSVLSVRRDPTSMSRAGAKSLTHNVEKATKTMVLAFPAMLASNWRTKIVLRIRISPYRTRTAKDSKMEYACSVLRGTTPVRSTVRKLAICAKLTMRITANV